MKSFTTAQNVQPILEQLPNGYTLKIAYKTDKDSIVCKFSRTATVPTGSEKLMYDLYYPLFTLKAYGEYDAVNKNIKYHRFGNSGASISTKAVNLVPSRLKVSDIIEIIMIKDKQTQNRSSSFDKKYIQLYIKKHIVFCSNLIGKFQGSIFFSILFYSFY